MLPLLSINIDLPSTILVHDRASGPKLQAFPEEAVVPELQYEGERRVARRGAAADDETPKCWDASRVRGNRCSEPTTHVQSVSKRRSDVRKRRSPLVIRYSGTAMLMTTTSRATKPRSRVSKNHNIIRLPQRLDRLRQRLDPLAPDLGGPLLDDARVLWSGLAPII